MTETEQKAAEAWPLVYDHEMPAKIALDFVQDAAGERPVALEALVVQAVCALANARPSVVAQEAAGSYCDFEAGAIGAALLAKQFDKAMGLIARLKRRLLDAQMVGPIENQGAWVKWCDDVERGRLLLRELVKATYPTRMLLRWMEARRPYRRLVLQVYRVERGRRGVLVCRLVDRLGNGSSGRPELNDTNRYTAGAHCAHNWPASSTDLRAAAGLDQQTTDREVRAWWDAHLPRTKPPGKRQ